jgi:hypothetical protein
VKLAVLALATLAVAGCSDAVSERKEPFAPSTPPPGYLEQKMKDRETAPKTGQSAADAKK